MPSPVDWNAYTEERILGRNRLLSEQHQEVVSDFLHYFANLDLETSVLDVGCSAGFFLGLLRELGFTGLTGIDISSHAIDQARRKGFKCHVASAMDPDSLAGLERTKIVLLMDVLEHLERPTEALQHIRQRLLVPGERIFLSVPSYHALSERVSRVLRRRSRLEQAQMHDPTHLHAFTPSQLRERLCDAGYEVEQMRRLFYPLPRAIPRHVRTLISACLPQIVKGRFLRVVARDSSGG